MPKAYWIAHVTVTDPVAYDEYRRANAVPFAQYGARFVIRGGPQTVVEGDLRARSVVIEFPSMEAATGCYHSPDYQAAKALRVAAGVADICIVEGWDG